MKVRYDQIQDDLEGWTVPSEEIPEDANITQCEYYEWG